MPETEPLSVEEDVVALMSIGEFAARSHLSAKALRLYDRLDLLPPAEVDPATGYRLYREDQVATARLIGLLRRLDMPLAQISLVVSADPDDAISMLASFWSGASATFSERNELVGYILARLKGTEPSMYDVQTRAVPARTVVTLTRHVHLDETDAFFDDAFARLRASGTGIPGITGAPYLIFYGEVSADSDGPLELCRPVSDVAVDPTSAVEPRLEPAHEEAFIRLSQAEMASPATLQAADQLERWAGDNDRRPAGPVRQVLIADQRTARPDTLVCDITIPLR